MHRIRPLISCHARMVAEQHRVAARKRWRLAKERRAEAVVMRRLETRPKRHLTVWYHLPA